MTSIDILLYLVPWSAIIREASFYRKWEQIQKPTARQYSETERLKTFSPNLAPSIKSLPVRDQGTPMEEEEEDTEAEGIEDTKQQGLPNQQEWCAYELREKQHICSPSRHQVLTFYHCPWNDPFTEEYALKPVLKEKYCALLLPSTVGLSIPTISMSIPYPSNEEHVSRSCNLIPSRYDEVTAKSISLIKTCEDDPLPPTFPLKFQLPITQPTQHDKQNTHNIDNSIPKPFKTETKITNQLNFSLLTTLKISD